MVQKTKRSNRLEVRLSCDERAEIERRARANGITLSCLIRHAALNIQLPARRISIEAEAVAALNRVGVNLNQIAKIGNMNKCLSAADLRALSILRVAATEAVRAIHQGDGK